MSGDEHDHGESDSRQVAVKIVKLQGTFYLDLDDAIMQFAAAHEDPDPCVIHTRDWLRNIRAIASEHLP